MKGWDKITILVPRNRYFLVKRLLEKISVHCEISTEYDSGEPSKEFMKIIPDPYKELKEDVE